MQGTRCLCTGYLIEALRGAADGGPPARIVRVKNELDCATTCAIVLEEYTVIPPQSRSTACSRSTIRGSCFLSTTTRLCPKGRNATTGIPARRRRGSGTSCQQKQRSPVARDPEPPRSRDPQSIRDAADERRCGLRYVCPCEVRGAEAFARRDRTVPPHQGGCSIRGGAALDAHSEERKRGEHV